MSEELKPCPFCGAAAEIIKSRLEHLNYIALFHEEFYVICHACGVKSASQIYKEGAIQAWNNRWNELTVDELPGPGYGHGV